MAKKKKDKIKEDKAQPSDDHQQVIEQLQEARDVLQAERDELREKLQRVSADYANYQKRVPKQVSDSVAYEKEKILKSVLPVLDNFEHTLQNAAGTEDVEVIVKGIRIVYDQMMDVLTAQGVEQIVTINEMFDPTCHEAMLQQNDPDKEDGLILQEFQKGYSLNGRVIRPSKVIVNKVATTQATDELEASVNGDEEDITPDAEQEE
ncbi:nucleotide exchange factor GrpE [Planctomycetota bacterium]